MKQSKDELLESKKILKKAQKIAKNKKIIRLKQGFSYEFEKLKNIIRK